MLLHTHKTSLEDHEALYKQMKLSKYVKDRCVMCQHALPDNVANYIERGNYCGSCNALCEQQSKQRRQTGSDNAVSVLLSSLRDGRRDKNGKLTMRGVLG